MYIYIYIFCWQTPTPYTHIQIMYVCVWCVHNISLFLFIIDLVSIKGKTYNFDILDLHQLMVFETLTVPSKTEKKKMRFNHVKIYIRKIKKIIHYNEIYIYILSYAEILHPVYTGSKGISFLLPAQQIFVTFYFILSMN